MNFYIKMRTHCTWLYIWLLMIWTFIETVTRLLQVTELPFFASKVRLGRTGAEEIYPLGPLNEYERYVVKHVNSSCKLQLTSFYIEFKFQFPFVKQGWFGEGKKGISCEHRKGGFLHKKVSLCQWEFFLKTCCGLTYTCPKH